MKHAIDLGDLGRERLIAERREPQRDDVERRARRQDRAGPEAAGGGVKPTLREHCGGRFRLASCEVEGKLAIGLRPARLEIEERPVLIEENGADSHYMFSPMDGPGSPLWSLVLDLIP